MGPLARQVGSVVRGRVAGAPGRLVGVGAGMGVTAGLTARLERRAGILPAAVTLGGTARFVRPDGDAV
ncbi:hypothetical protein, partial [Methylobacterium sp. WL69]|uniref:hypothetical protein n=1 Tax=Methylobacterium sp. WL69 TaxID=2603893 RepID=UPI001AEE1FF3